MKYLNYIKDFDDLAAQNEKIYEFKKLFNTNIDEFIDYYYSDEMSSLEEYEHKEDVDINYMLLTNHFQKSHSVIKVTSDLGF
jgi:hypothetical protein